MPVDVTQATTRDLILEAAESLFAREGYQATTIKQVAEQVGVQGPALYKHFASKRALFEEVLERLFAPFKPLLTDEVTTGGSQREIMQLHVANPNIARIVAQATLSGGEDLALLVERWYRPFFSHTRALPRADVNSFSPVAVMAFHSMLLGYLTLAPLHQKIFDTDPLSGDALSDLLELQETLAKSIQ